LERTRVHSGSEYEDSIGFSRAIRIGSRCLVSGTAPIWPDGSCRNDAKAQTLRCFEIIGGALAELGASLDDVVRTRIYLVDPSDADKVGHAHAQALGEARPAATMVIVAGLLDSRWLVEIEAEAEIGS
jgi:enamine deaminase RidA (YjgF/YER057c/UK114 family)